MSIDRQGSRTFASLFSRGRSSSGIPGHKHRRFSPINICSSGHPRAIVFVEALPRTPNGKLMRSGLKLPEDFSTG